MKSILMSIRPEWARKIFDGEKTIEVRKTRPLIDMPFKVYVYCTKQKLTKTTCMHSYLHKNEPKACKKYGEITTWCSIGDVHVNSNTPWSFRSFGMHGKVIGSFVCDKIEKITPSVEWGSHGYDTVDDDLLKEMCLERGYLEKYGAGVTLYGWHITSPKLFDKPRELGEFTLGRGFIAGRFPLTRPPRSWCYVEGE